MMSKELIYEVVNLKSLTIHNTSSGAFF